MNQKKHLALQPFSENVDYIISQYPLYIRLGQLSTYPEYRALPHWHEDIEFNYVYSGEMDMEVNGSIVTLHAGEGIVINSRSFHYGYSDEQKECKFICILIHPSLFSTNSYIQDRYVRPFTESASLPYIHLCKENWHGQLADILMEISALNIEDTDFFLRCQPHITKIFQLLWTNTKETILGNETAPNHTLAALRQMVQFIQNHYEQPLTLAEIARAGSMSKTSCCNVFRRYLHSTPVEYLLTYRMSQSMNLLSESDLSITEIAYAVGFHDSSYFTKYFHSYYGKTPREIRKS